MGIFLQISQIWAVCHRYMQRRQFLQAVITARISTNLLRPQARYFHPRISKVMIISHATLICASYSATVRTWGNHQSKSSNLFFPIRFLFIQNLSEIRLLYYNFIHSLIQIHNDQKIAKTQWHHNQSSCSLTSQSFRCRFTANTAHK